MILLQKMDLVIISGLLKVKRPMLLLRNCLLEKVPYTYVADGHHVLLLQHLVGKEKRENNPTHNGTEEYNFFLAVHFPENQFRIIDYNRTIKDLNGLSDSEFIKRLEKAFIVEEKGNRIYKPKELHNFSMYLEWEMVQPHCKRGNL